MLELLGMALHWLGIILAGLWVVVTGWELDWYDLTGEEILFVFGPALGLYLVGRAGRSILAGY